MSDLTDEEQKVIRRAARRLCRREEAVRLAELADAVELDIGLRYDPADLANALGGALQVVGDLVVFQPESATAAPLQTEPAAPQAARATLTAEVGLLPAPQSLGELLHMFLEQQHERTRAILRGLYLERQSVEELSEQWTLAPERVQQIATITAKDREPFQQHARSLLAQEVSELEHRDGFFTVVPRESAGMVMLGLALAGHHCSLYEGVVCSIATRNEVDRVLREALRAGNGSSLLRPSELAVLENTCWAEDMSPVGVLLAIVRGMEVSNLDDIMAWYGTMVDARPELSPLARGEAQHLLEGEPSVWNVHHGQYIHESALPCSPQDLLSLADWAIGRLSGSAVGVDATIVLQQALKEGVTRKGVTPHLLRDAFRRHAQGVTFRSTLVLAHVDSAIARKRKLTEELRAILSAEAPMSLQEIHTRLAPLGFSVAAISIALLNDSKVLRTGKEFRLRLDTDGESVAEAAPAPRRDEYVDTDSLARFSRQLKRQLKRRILLRRDEVQEVGAGLGFDEAETYRALVALKEDRVLLQLPGGYFSLGGSRELVLERWTRRHKTIRALVRGEINECSPEALLLLAIYFDRDNEESEAVGRILERLVRGIDGVPGELRQEAERLQHERNLATES